MSRKPQVQAPLGSTGPRPDGGQGIRVSFVFIDTGPRSRTEARLHPSGAPRRRDLQYRAYGRTRPPNLFLRPRLPPRPTELGAASQKPAPNSSPRKTSDLQKQPFTSAGHGSATIDKTTTTLQTRRPPISRDRRPQHGSLYLHHHSPRPNLSIGLNGIRPCLWKYEGPSWWRGVHRNYDFWNRASTGSSRQSAIRRDRCGTVWHARLFVPNTCLMALLARPSSAVGQAANAPRALLLSSFFLPCLRSVRQGSRSSKPMGHRHFAPMASGMPRRRSSYQDSLGSKPEVRLTRARGDRISARAWVHRRRARNSDDEARSIVGGRFDLMRCHRRAGRPRR